MFKVPNSLPLDPFLVGGRQTDRQTDRDIQRQREKTDREERAIREREREKKIREGARRPSDTDMS